jgi:hypothetical protein
VGAGVVRVCVRVRVRGYGGIRLPMEFLRLRDLVRNNTGAN